MPLVQLRTQVEAYVPGRTPKQGLRYLQLGLAVGFTILLLTAAAANAADRRPSWNDGPAKSRIQTFAHAPVPPGTKVDKLDKALDEANANAGS